jgi:hypothetical protein
MCRARSRSIRWSASGSPSADSRYVAMNWSGASENSQSRCGNRTNRTEKPSNAKHPIAIHAAAPMSCFTSVWPPKEGRRDCCRQLCDHRECYPPDRAGVAVQDSPASPRQYFIDPDLGPRKRPVVACAGVSPPTLVAHFGVIASEASRSYQRRSWYSSSSAAASASPPGRRWL